MARPRLQTDDPVLVARREKNRIKVQQHRQRQKKLGASKAPTRKLNAPLPTLPPPLSYTVPPRSYSFALAREVTNLNERNDENERIYCGRSRLKSRMRVVFQELEDTLVQLKEAGFVQQKRGGGSQSKFKWLFQFDVYNHSTRHRKSAGYEPSRPGTCIHNIESLRRKDIRVRLSSRKEMIARLQGNQQQKELQEAAWTLVDKIVQAVPPLKEWAGENLDYKVQFSMMTSSSHGVLPHTDSNDIAPQFSICLGDYTGGHLLTWDQGKQSDLHPHSATDVRNKLLLFDGRLKHAVDAWKGKYRINVAFYKHYDRRWTKRQSIQARPLLILDLNQKLQFKN